jgi:hypothetical protein
LQQRLVAPDLPVKRKLAFLAGVALAGVVAVVVWARRGDSPHHDKADTTSVHATGIDQTDSSASMIAMINAPEGATPCESAYNALAAEQAAARLRKSKSLFTWVAAKDDFLARCGELPDKAQQCMAPRYRRSHDDCATARPPDAVLAKLFIAEPVVLEKLPGEP